LTGRHLDSGQLGAVDMATKGSEVWLPKYDREALKQSVSAELRPCLDLLAKTKDWPLSPIVALLSRRLRDLFGEGS